MILPVILRLAGLALLIVCFLAVLGYLYLRRSYRYWADRGVVYLKPHLLFGNMQPTVMKGISEVEHNRNLYRQLSPHKFGGYFRFQRPALMIRDPELIKSVLAKDFSYFQARNKNLHRQNDPLSYNLFALNGSQWKRLRTKLTPTFTSGKIKQMFHLVKECADLLSDVIDDIGTGSIGTSSSSSSSSNGYVVRDDDTSSKHPIVELEMKELLAGYSTDVISSCAYGVQANSLKNPDTEFRHLGKRILGMTFRRKVFRLLNAFSPNIVRFFGLIFWERYLVDFFLKLIADTVAYREQNDVKRNDFLNILMALRKEDLSSRSSSADINDSGANTEFVHRTEEETPENDKLEMTFELMAAQCFVFFLAGFETSSSTISVCLLELAKDQHVQNELRREVEEVIERNNGELTYDTLQSMPYMEKVIAETMRLYPSLSVLLRQCTKQYQIPETNVVIDEGTEVFIPVYGLHRDPQYYPNPDEFNPENFSEENKTSRPSFAYLPFGEGPRICIGARFGSMQVKLALATLLRRYKFTLSPKMKLPVKFVPKALTTVVQGGIWLNCSKCC